ncbi:MAG: hypothetical protein AB7F88_01370 [Pyrinomonadaceae bacterium]
MKTFTKMLKPLFTDIAPTERFSLRFQDGVEIYEHESVRTYSPAQPDAAACDSVPRLVVTEMIGIEESGLIARTRSEVVGLVAILSAVTAAR